MKKTFCYFSAVILIWLTPACVSAGRNADSSTAQNQRADEARVSGAGASEAEAPTAAQRVGTLFRGSVGGAKVEMDIKREGESLAGSYYYLKSGSANRLALKGKVAADGTFTMQESDAGGKQTGQFKGTWKQD